MYSEDQRKRADVRVERNVYFIMEGTNREILSISKEIVLKRKRGNHSTMTDLFI